jgi:hypothetical protein
LPADVVQHVAQRGEQLVGDLIRRVQWLAQDGREIADTVSDVVETSR